MKHAPWLIVLLLAAAPLDAFTQQDATLEVLGAPARGAHVFGGIGSPVELAIDAPLGAAVSLRADLIQITSGLAAPLQKDIAVGEPLDFSNMTHRRIRWEAPVPAVKRITKMMVQFRLQSPTGGADSRLAGRTLFTVYPETSPEWESLAKRAGLRLAVFGPAKNLRAFFKARGLKFEDMGDHLPTEELPAGAVCIGEASRAETARWFDSHAEPKGAFIVFCPDPDALPLIDLETRPGGCTVKITAPLLEELPADPRAQQTLAVLLNRALDLSPPAP